MIRFINESAENENINFILRVGVYFYISLSLRIIIIQKKNLHWYNFAIPWSFIISVSICREIAENLTLVKIGGFWFAFRAVIPVL